eukprot:TRINITY_DN2661_c0_g1_i2.p1 TRINITY_DN2661_c0_g1~~TRINITY_DN2661_c0_g1_i2.p1  ORF type:complete len:276 (+),score=-4.62 TRINITY_DN2661_c0_g1_i2:77-904(+)
MLNTGATYVEVVTEGKCKKTKSSTLLDYYVANYPHSSRAAWEKRIIEGNVVVDDLVVTDPAYPLQNHSVLKYYRSPWSEPTVPSTIPILYQDSNIIVANKPSGTPVLPGGYFNQNTVLNILKTKLQETVMLEPIEMIAPVHRLGRGTSGILLISCTKASSRVLSKAFVERQIEKHYLAILSGIPTWDQKKCKYRYRKGLFGSFTEYETIQLSLGSSRAWKAFTFFLHNSEKISSQGSDIMFSTNPNRQATSDPYSLSILWLSTLSRSSLCCWWWC